MAPEALFDLFLAAGGQSEPILNLPNGGILQKIFLSKDIWHTS